MDMPEVLPLIKAISPASPPKEPIFKDGEEARYIYGIVSGLWGTPSVARWGNSPTVYCENDQFAIGAENGKPPKKFIHVTLQVFEYNAGMQLPSERFVIFVNAEVTGLGEDGSPLPEEMKAVTEMYDVAKEDFVEHLALMKEKYEAIKKESLTHFSA